MVPINQSSSEMRLCISDGWSLSPNLIFKKNKIKISLTGSSSQQSPLMDWFRGYPNFDVLSKLWVCKHCLKICWTLFHSTGPLEWKFGFKLDQGDWSWSWKKNAFRLNFFFFNKIFSLSFFDMWHDVNDTK